MAAGSRNPYEVLGVGRSASDAEVRAAYRRLVQRHHPDHNHGSVESARRFEEVQEAYAEVVKLRARPARAADQADVDVRIADLERQVRAARAARERAERDAAEARRRAARTASTDLREHATRASDEELGYVSTDDSLGKLLEDAWGELQKWLGDVRSSDKP